MCAGDLQLLRSLFFFGDKVAPGTWSSPIGYSDKSVRSRDPLGSTSSVLGRWQMATDP